MDIEKWLYKKIHPKNRLIPDRMYLYFFSLIIKVKITYNCIFLLWFLFLQDLFDYSTFIAVQWYFKIWKKQRLLF